MTVQQAFDAALLADAAYLNLPVLVPGATLSGELLVAELRQAAPGKPPRLTEAQARYIAERYDLVAFEPNGSGNFQAAVFRDKRVAAGSPGEYVLAIRGSAEAQDFYGADAHLTLLSRAFSQTSAMYEFIERLARPLGSGGFGLFTATTQFDVTAHSLGGHLTQRLVAEHSNLVNRAYTFNGAGLGGNVLFPNARNVSFALEAARRLFGGSPNQITNIIGEPGIDVVPSSITGPKLGFVQEIFAEDQTPVPPFFVAGNHLMDVQVDSMAVHRAFEALSPAAAFDYATMRAILRASSHDDLASLEAATNWLAALFPGAGAAPSIAIGDREALHDAAIKLGDFLQGAGSGAYQLVSLLGMSQKDLAALAMQDTAEGRAARYAMLNGVPFTVNGANYGALAAAATYNVGNFSAEHWRQRAEYFQHLMGCNTQDVDASTNVAGEREFVVDDLNRVWIDRASNTRLTPEVSGSPSQSPHVIFGAETDDQGADALSGGDSYDYIFGGLGHDHLFGNGGSDHLEGGAGDDWLNGGTGGDQLFGGEGNDTYFFLADSNGGLVNDSDGHGSINIQRADGSSYTLGSAPIRQVAEGSNFYIDGEGNRFLLHDGDLVVSLVSGISHIVIDDFQTMGGSRLGLTLEDFDTVDPPPATVTYNVGAPNQIVSYSSDEAVRNSQIEAMGLYSNNEWRSAAVRFHRRDVEIINVAAAIVNPANDQHAYARTVGGMGDSYITGDAGINVIRDDGESHLDEGDVRSAQAWFPGNSSILGIYPVEPNLALGIWGPVYSMGPTMGNDRIDAGAGNDIVYTSGGDDVVNGGEGDDIIVDTHGGGEARPDQSYTYNGIMAQGVTYIYDWDSTEWVSQPGHTSNDRLLGDAGNDYIAAHGGKQFMDGGADHDELFAGAGDDVLHGDVGNDVLAGDIYVYENPTQAIVDGSGFITGIVLNGDALRSATTEFGSDTIDGGAGDDTIFGGGGNDILIGGGGNDRIQGDFEGAAMWADLREGLISLAADPASIAGADIISGGSGDDVIYAGGGDDSVDAGGDNDTVHGGSGDDTIYGGAGADTLLGDDPTGSQGADVIHGDDGSDIIEGGGGADLLYGDADDDSIHGGDGNDLLEGGTGNDQLYGEANDDVLNGGAGHDQLHGGDGNDRLEADGGDDELYGGAGDDLFVLSRGAGQVQINDTQGSNALTFGPGVPATDLRLRMVGGQVIIQYSLTDYAAMDQATFETLAFDFAQHPGVSLTISELRHLFEPEAVADGTLQLESGVALGDVGYHARNADLILSYSGSASDWIDTSTLAARNIQFEVGSGSSYGLPVGTKVLVLTNWYQAAPETYVRELRDASGNIGQLSTAAAAVGRTFVGTAEIDVLEGTAGDDVLFAFGGSDVLTGGDGDDQLSGGTGSDLLMGGAGNDTYVILPDEGQDIVADAGGSADFLIFGAGIQAGDLTLTRRAEGLYVQIGAPTANNSVLIVNQNGSGGPVLPIEYFQFADGAVWNSAAIDSHVGNHAPVAGAIASQTARIDQEFGFTVPSNTFTDADPGDQLTYSASLAGGQALPPWLTFDPGTQAFHGTPPAGALGTLEVRVTAVDPTGLLASSTFVLTIAPPADQGTSGDDTLTGDESDNALDGLAGNDTLYGLGGNDALYGSQGNDWLDGGAGADEMTGGDGNDTFVVDDSGDIVRENADEGTDHIQSSITYALGDHVEHLTLTGTADLNATGNALANTLVGNSGSNVLDGGPGVDSMQGGAGDDLYIVDHAMDVVTELAGSGLDTVQSSVSFTLANHVENLTLTGTAAIGGAGNALDNVLVGNAGDNTLSGAGGNDTLEGGAGNDVLAGGSGNNTYVFGRGDGQDTIDSFIDSTPGKLNTLSLRADVQLADIVLTRSNNDLVLSIAGAADAVTIKNVSSAQANPVQQLRFADGAIWSLSYIMAAGATSLAMADAMALAATGNSSNNTITGTSASNVIDGGAGADTLIGGAGDDTYIVDTTRTNYFWDQSPELWNFLDTVTEQAGEGYDTVVARDIYSAMLSVEAERLVIVGGLTNFNVSFTLAQDVRKRFTGNSLDNVIDASLSTGPVIGEGYIGVGGIDLGETVIDGGAGADIMIGSAGRTRFVVDNVGDVVISNSSITHIESFISYTLAATYGDLRLRGSLAISGTGNALANVMDGSTNSAGNVLAGGAGNDTYIVGAGDTVVENAAEGIDSVTSNVSFTLSDNVENLTLIGNSNIDGTGNALDNIITGTDAQNVLEGGAGNDQLIGAGNHDRYTGFGAATGLDVIVESGVGFDTIEFAPGSSSNVEQWQFSRIGNDLNVVTGPDSAIRVQNWYSSANNQIDQVWVYHDGLRYIYAGSRLQARADGVNTAPTPNAPAVNQMAMASQVFSYQVAANVFADIESQHSLVYSATLSDGSPLPSWLTFDPATRTFSGTPTSLDVDSFSVRLTATDAGSLSSSTTFFINVQPLQLIGTPGNDTLIGDEGNNPIQGLEGDDTLIGMAGDDSLVGDEGNDILDGGTGIDEMYGGLGDDIYYVDSVDDYIEEYSDEGTDEIRSSISYTLPSTSSNSIENLTLLAGATAGTGNSGDNVIIGNSANNTLTGGGGHDTLDGGGGTDTLNGGAGNDTYITDGGDTLQDSSGTDTVRSSVTFTLASGFEHLVLTGTGNINGTGNSAANQITGNDGNNTLTGSGGADTLTGGNGADVYSYSTGHGADTINNASTDSAQDRLNVTNLTSSQVTFSRTGDDLLMTRNSTPSDNVRVLGWFADTGNQLDFVQFTNQTLTAAQINALFAGSLMSGQFAVRDDWNRSLARFVDAMNHFDGRRARFAVVEDAFEASAASSEWLSAPAPYEGGATRSWSRLVGRALS